MSVLDVGRLFYIRFCTGIHRRRKTVIFDRLPSTSYLRPRSITKFLDEGPLQEENGYLWPVPSACDLHPRSITKFRTRVLHKRRVALLGWLPLACDLCPGFDTISWTRVLRRRRATILDIFRIDFYSPPLFRVQFQLVLSGSIKGFSRIINMVFFLVTLLRLCHFYIIPSFFPLVAGRPCCSIFGRWLVHS